MAIKKCPNGMLSEIKYDGERVQVHKNGNKFSYFSRSLKSVMPHKVKKIKIINVNHKCQITVQSLVHNESFTYLMEKVLSALNVTTFTFWGKK